MHLTRKSAPTNLPITRKGTKYLVSATAFTSFSVPVLIALREMLGLAKTTREVKHLIHSHLVKLNGRDVRDFKESITLFSILQADKSYVLTLLPTGKFTLQETKATTRIAKIISRTLISGGKLQLNLHDGTNVIGKENMKVGDSLVLDFEGKVKSHKSFEKSAEVFVIKGASIGQTGIVQSIQNNKVKVKFGKEESTLSVDNVIVI